MEVLTAAGAGFLLAVLWFDLMFDVQVRGRGEPADVDRGERYAQAVPEAAQLRHAHVDRRLATFEPARERRAGPRQLTFRATAGGLALPGGDAASQPAAAMTRAIRRP
jgi:hypothetical protein